MDYTPLKMRPCFKNYLWGGHRLKQEYGKVDAPATVAESWELADHVDGMSVVEAGPLAGRTISELGKLSHDGFWGTSCIGDTFPILVKLIDAEKDLSIQVHPSERNALRQIGEQGKAEMWYILDCGPQSFLYYGFSRKISKAEFLRRAEDGTICEVLNRVPVQKGDIFYILPGTIHAIGRGNVIAEIQQNSNTTFRIYDYQRRDADGRYRELHLERAAAVLEYTPVIPEECRVNSAVSFPEFSLSEMFSCLCFQAFRVDVRTSIRLLCDGRSFQHILCAEGEGVICCKGDQYPFRRGDSYFMPAALGEYRIEGACRVLLSRTGKDEVI